jgi:hypothetical protein
VLPDIGARSYGGRVCATPGASKSAAVIFLMIMRLQDLKDAGRVLEKRLTITFYDQARQRPLSVFGFLMSATTGGLPSGGNCQK